MNLLLRLLSRLPLRVLYAFAAVLDVLIYHLLRYRREVVLENLRGAFPDLDEREIRTVARAFYRHLAALAAEVIGGPGMSREEFSRRVHFANPEVIEAAAAGQRRVVFVAIHQGNWEWLLLASCVRFALPVDAVYKPFHSPAMDRFMLELRSRFGGRPLPVERVLRALAGSTEETRALGLVADQAPLAEQEHHWVRFLNRDTAFFFGMEALARVARCPVVFLGMVRTGRGRYEVTATVLSQPPHPEQKGAIVDAYAAAAERAVRADPAAWLWSHRRWKRGRAA